MIHLTLQERKVALFLFFLFAAAAALSVFKKSSGCNVCLIDMLSAKTIVRSFDINQVSREELISLPGIGEKGADDIIALRAERGRITDLSELDQIKGFSAVKIETLKKYLYIRS